MKMSTWLFWFVGISLLTMVSLWARDGFREQVGITDRLYQDVLVKHKEFNPSLEELKDPKIKAQRKKLDAAVEVAKNTSADAIGMMDMFQSASLAGMLSLVGMMVMWPITVDWRRDPKRKEPVVEGKAVAGGLV